MKISSKIFVIKNYNCVFRCSITVGYAKHNNNFRCQIYKKFKNKFHTLLLTQLY